MATDHNSSMTPNRRKTDDADNPVLTVSFDPTLIENYDSLRAYIAHRVQVNALPAKTIAANMDLSPSMLSRKLHPGETDTQRFNCDDLETYIHVSGDTTVIDYLATKYLQSDASRKARLLSRVEALATDIERSLRELRRAS